jgi:hypothetical protein
VSAPKTRIQFYSVFEIWNGFGKVIRRVESIVGPASKERIIGFRAVGLLLGLPLLLSRRQIHCQRRHDALRDFVLQFKHVIERTVVAFCPKMATGSRIYELCINPYLLSGAAHTAFQNVTHPEFCGHLPHLHRPSLVGEHRVPCDDEKAG